MLCNIITDVPFYEPSVAWAITFCASQTWMAGQAPGRLAIAVLRFTERLPFKCVHEHEQSVFILKHFPLITIIIIKKIWKIYLKYVYDAHMYYAQWRAGASLSTMGYFETVNVRESIAGMAQWRTLYAFSHCIVVLRSDGDTAKHHRHTIIRIIKLATLEQKISGFKKRISAFAREASVSFANVDSSIAWHNNIRCMWLMLTRSNNGQRVLLYIMWGGGICQPCRNSLLLFA